VTAKLRRKDMRNRIIPVLIAVIFCISFFGCADKAPPVVKEEVRKKTSQGYHKFYVENYKPVDARGYVKKVNNFTIVFDPSASMTEAYIPSYKCIACHTEYQNSRYAEKHAIKYGGREFAKKDKSTMPWSVTAAIKTPCTTNSILQKILPWV
jgi:OmpA-OmpF porin, OOP family